MKKIKKYVIIFIIVIIAISLSYSVYSIFNENKGNNDNIKKDKVLSEVQYLENKFLNLFNSLNNIQYENYRIYSNKIDVNNQEDKNINNYDLKLEGVLNNQDINWGNIKNEIELIYTSIPTVTLDLYQLNLNKEDILAFNREFDVLTSEVNNENKETTLNQLCKLYAYLPKFLDNTNTDKKYKIILKTKSSIFEAYSVLDSENWSEMNIKIDDAINNFKELLELRDKNKNNQSSINKCYIMLNELKNATNQKNKEVFLIKYRNLLEEISNI